MFDNLPFQEQLALVCLSDLQTGNVDASEDHLKVGQQSFKTTNPDFYLLKSRTQGMDLFQELLEQELTSLSNKYYCNNKNYNLSKNHRLALQSLEQNTNIIIKMADKGGSVVVLDKDMYEKQMLAMLSDVI